MPNLCDSYSETNQNDVTSIYKVHPSATDDFSSMGQSFTGNGESLNSCKLYMKKATGSPGLMIARLYEHTGTWGSSGVPTGAALDSSSSINASTLSTSFALVEFTGFSGYTLVNGTHYCIVVECLSGTWDVSNYVQLGLDTTSSAHAGNGIKYLNSAWGYYATYDHCFYVYTLPAVLSITTQAASSIEDTTATGNGNITDLIGGGDADHRGVVWDVSTKSAPGDVTPALSGYANNTDESGTFGTGAFTASITGLPTGTTIYYRAWAHNSLGYAYGDEVTFLTKPAAPTNVSATDGTHTTKVTITWTKSTGATDYHVWRDASDLGAAGDVATFDDTGADAPVITPGTASASDGTSTAHVVLSLAGESASNGTTHTYKVVASNATGNSDDSATDTGYRGTTTLTYAWQRSAGDSDASYSVISGGTTDPYNDTGAPNPTITAGTTSATDGDHADKVVLSLSGESLSDGEGRYYKCVVSMSGAVSQTSTADRGYKSNSGSISYQAQVSAADSDASYSNITGATTDPYDYMDAPVWGEGRYYKYVLSSTGASNATSTADRGYTTAPDNFPGVSSLKVRIAFDSGWDDTDPVWAEVQNEVREIHTFRGRNLELDRMESGTMDIVLNNENGNFWSQNTESDYYPNVLPMKRINVRAYYNGVKEIFTGYIKSYTPSFLGAGGYGSIMKLHCVGIIGSVVALQVLNNAGYAEEAAGLRMEHILTDCGIPAAWIDGDAGSINVQATGALVNQNALDQCYKVTESDLGLFYELNDGTILYEDRGHRALSPHTISQATFGDGGIGYTDFSWVLNDNLIFNEIRITRTGGSEQSTENTDSQDKYCTRSYVKTGMLHSTDAEVLTQTDYFCARYAEPFAIVTGLTINPDNSDKWSQVFTREISDRITFINNDAYIDNDLFIESVQLDLDFINQEYSCIWSTSDATQYLNPLPPKTETLRPTAAGYITELTPSAGSNWDCVNDTTPDEDSTNVYGGAVKYDLYNIQDLPWDYGVIDSVTVTARCKVDAPGTSNAYIRIRTHSTTYTGAMKVLTTSYANYSQVWAVNPYTGLAWTVDEVNSLQIGIQVDPFVGSAARCTQIYADVVITPTWG